MEGIARLKQLALCTFTHYTGVTVHEINLCVHSSGKIQILGKEERKGSLADY